MCTKENEIIGIAKELGWIESEVSTSVSFIAAGEYNENWLLQVGNAKHVFRINHGSQMGFSHQSEYEFKVLKAVESSGVTPVPYYYSNDGCGLGRGLLLMSYIEGGEFVYERDSSQAAAVFAHIHNCPASSELVAQPDPVVDIARESLGLLERYPDHPRKETFSFLMKYYHKICALAEECAPLWLKEQQVVVNTEVNSGNFIVDSGKVSLVDWEKAVVSCRYQDLAHFIIPTTTLWRTDFRFTSETRLEFLQKYHEALASLGGEIPSFEEMDYKTSVLEKTILLRAMSWCFMAWYEYTREDRALKSDITFGRISRYLDEIECFLK
ncbi:MAG: aminoglycoside phosphotransferase family protein [Desulfovibrio sp.]